MENVNLIDQYIAGFLPATQVLLNRLRSAIKQSAPEAQEAIKYGIPTFILQGNLVHFAAYKNHIGFYPTPAVIIHFSTQLSDYVTSKGAIQFPIDKPIPLSLIHTMVTFRVQEQLQKQPKK